MTPRQWRYAIPAAIRHRRRALARRALLLLALAVLAALDLAANAHILAALRDHAAR
jgi:hypothetical protein